MALAVLIFSEGFVNSHKVNFIFISAQSLASYFGDPGEFSMFSSLVFRNFGEKSTEKIMGPENLKLNNNLLYIYCHLGCS